MDTTFDGYKMTVCIMALLIVIMGVALFNSRQKSQPHTARDELLAQYDEALLRALQHEAQAEAQSAAAKVYKARAARLKEAATAARASTPPAPPRPINVIAQFRNGGLVPGLPASPAPDLPSETRVPATSPSI